MRWRVSSTELMEGSAWHLWIILRAAMVPFSRQVRLTPRPMGLPCKADPGPFVPRSPFLTSEFLIKLSQGLEAGTDPMVRDDPLHLCFTLALHPQDPPPAGMLKPNVLQQQLCLLPTHHQSASPEFHETCHSVTFYFMKKDSKRCCDIATPQSIHTKDESKRGTAFAFIFGVN